MLLFFIVTNYSHEKAFYHNSFFKTFFSRLGKLKNFKKWSVVPLDISKKTAAFDSQETSQSPNYFAFHRKSGKTGNKPVTF